MIVVNSPDAGLTDKMIVPWVSMAFRNLPGPSLGNGFPVASSPQTEK